MLYIRASESLSLSLMLLGEIILLKDEKHCRQCGWDNQSGGAGECESTEAEARRGQQNKIHIHGYECRLHLHQGIGAINQKGCQRTESEREKQREGERQKGKGSVCVCVCVCVTLSLTPLLPPSLECNFLECQAERWGADNVS